MQFITADIIIVKQCKTEQPCNFAKNTAAASGNFTSNSSTKQLTTMNNRLLPAIDMAKDTTRSTFFYRNIWKEHTTLLIHGSREADKTAVALDIALSLPPRDTKVIYVDTQRILDDHRDKLSLAENMLILRSSYQSPDDRTDYADLVISSIEEAVAETDVRVFVVDSVSRIAALSFGRNASAAYVMKRLVAIQVRCGISLIVLSHDSTRAVDRSLANLADSMIEVGTEPSENTPQADTAVPLPEKKTEEPQYAIIDPDKPYVEFASWSQLTPLQRYSLERGRQEQQEQQKRPQQ